MSDESNFVLALKNAWAGVELASTRVAELGQVAQRLEGEDTEAIDLEACQAAVMGQSIAVASLRGLLDELQRRRTRTEA